ncbi:MAG: 6,7-dimethyl-8-ribityllumazine synthase [Desulfurococcales archaeon]|nr:6,7-dimethyl-8-ribityllumazine synthase [Desulfurococcales archaeon]MCE4622542.1 6,7-dimethyl-8-ribityllumazine synthase [Desulfurococcales archaeon]MCE4626842.1 6,7-dimethyl-8-ribityllumazine synthase [Desulfurococcales archaeon]MCE4630026.1 6,7-dimethyl-8-ribityllumazine synthase [Desulfurococcales archaeon]
MEKVRLGIVVSEFNYDITRLMLEKALSHAKFLGAEVTVVFKVPGTYDLPYGVKSVISLEHVDAVVALGAVIEGETEHDEVVAHQAARKLLDLGIEHGKPVTLGVIGPGASRMQALERAEEYARRAVEAAVKLVRRVKSLGKSEYRGELMDIE